LVNGALKRTIRPFASAAWGTKLVEAVDDEHLGFEAARGVATVPPRPSTVI